MFSAGLTGVDCRQCIVVTIVNDAAYEGDDDQFSVVVTSVGLGCSTSANSLATVYITENGDDGK